MTTQGREKEKEGLEEENRTLRFPRPQISIQVLLQSDTGIGKMKLNQLQRSIRR